MICDDAALKHTDIEVAQAYQRIRGRLNGDDQRILQAGQQLWMIERDNCRNLTVVHGAPGIFECVKEKMDERLLVLRTLIGDQSGLSTTVADYPFVYPSYLNNFSIQYAGKKVTIAGSIDMEACHKAKIHSLVGRLSDNGKSFEIRFRSLPAEQVDFLCSSKPFSWWYGEVRFDRGRPYLFATDVLGTPLP